MRDVARVVMYVLGCVPAPVIGEDVEAAYWRPHAERAEALVAELAAEAAQLSESVATLSGLLLGSYSEKSGSCLRGNGPGDDGRVRPGGGGKREQRPGRPGALGGGIIRIWSPRSVSSMWMPVSGAAWSAGSRLSSGILPSEQPRQDMICITFCVHVI